MSVNDPVMDKHKLGKRTEREWKLQNNLFGNYPKTP